MSLEPGQSLAHYRIDRKIGQGGMGEVWAATDTRLQRAAAIKTLPPAVAGDPDRLARFEREAKVLAALSHPNIAAIYGLEQVDRSPYLAMEMAEGEDLSARISGRPMPVNEAVEIALQIASALEEAHDKGIVHRDLKPANIKVASDGKVKVLDFGLAKALAADPAQSGISQDLSQSPTMTAAMGTQAGMILGTAGYMSPEQARGKTVDRRADIWAFGVILFEMLTGERLYGGETVTDIIASVVTREPDWNQLPDDVPAAMRRLLKRCLEKDPRKRLRHIGDAALELRDDSGDDPSTSLASGGLVPVASRGRAWLLGAGGLALGLVAALAIQAFLAPAAGNASPTWSNLAPPTGSPYDFTEFLEISPDGRRVVFVAAGPDDVEPVLWVRDLTSELPRPLAGTEGARQPFWSPDSQSIGFFANRKLRRVSAEGGASTVLADAGVDPRGAHWGADDTILFVPDWSRPVFRTTASGGPPEAVTVFEAERLDISHRWPHLLPDGQHFLFYVVSTYPTVNPENPSELDQSGLFIGSLDGTETRLLQAVPSRAAYTDGSLLFVDGGVLTARPFDVASLSFVGEPVAIAGGVTQSVDSLWGGGLFSVSNEGTLLFVRGAPERRAMTRLQWRDREGNDLESVGEPQSFSSLRLSHDGRRLATGTGDPGDVWLYDLARNTSTRFTFDTGNDELPVWSPGDDQILFQSNRVIPGKPFSPANLFQKAASGLAQEEHLAAVEIGPSLWPEDWAPDGRFVTLTGLTPGTGLSIMLFSTEDSTISSYLSAGNEEQSARFSPDGRWLAYVSWESGREEVYVQAFPGPGGKWQVSTGGGVLPSWRADGQELFYAGPDGLMAVTVQTEEGFQYGTPLRLFAFDPTVTAQGYYSYDVSADGQRFILMVPAEDEAAEDATVTLLQRWRTLLAQAAR